MMTEQSNLPKQKSQMSFMAFMVGFITIVISVCILYALAASASTIGQTIAFLLMLVAFLFAVYVGLHFLQKEP